MTARSSALFLVVLAVGLALFVLRGAISKEAGEGATSRAPGAVDVADDAALPRDEAGLGARTPLRDAAPVDDAPEIAVRLEGLDAEALAGASLFLVVEDVRDVRYYGLLYDSTDDSPYIGDSDAPHVLGRAGPPLQGVVRVTAASLRGVPRERITLVALSEDGRRGGRARLSSEGDATVELRERATIEVEVVDEHGDPVSGLRVLVRERVGRSGRDGVHVRERVALPSRFTLPVPELEAGLRIEAPGHEAVLETLSRERALGASPALRIVLPSLERIRGQVLLGAASAETISAAIRRGRTDAPYLVRAQGRSPIAFETRALGPWFRSRTPVETSVPLGPDGSFELGLPRLSAHEGRWLVVQAADAGAALWLGSSTEAELELQPLASVHGTAIAFVGLQGFSVCAVSAFGELRSAPIEAQTGRFELSGLIPGRWQLGVVCGDEPVTRLTVEEEADARAAPSGIELHLAGGDRRFVQLDGDVTPSRFVVELRTETALDWSTSSYDGSRSSVATPDGAARFELTRLFVGEGPRQISARFEARPGGLTFESKLSSTAEEPHRVSIPGGRTELALALPPAIADASPEDLELWVRATLESGAELFAGGSPLPEPGRWSIWAWEDAPIELEHWGSGRLWSGRVRANGADTTPFVEWD